MSRIFDMDNPVMRALAVAADLLVLNLLTMLCCVPVLTAGAAFAAMNDVLLHQVRGEEGYLLRSFFRSFAANFKKATLLWLVVLAALVLVGADYLAAGLTIPGLRVPVIAVGVLVIAWAMYVFALQSRYENPPGRTMKNAAALMVAYFPRTLGIVAFTGGFWLLAVKFWRIGAPLLLLFGLSLPCYVALLLLSGVFDKMEEKPSRADEDETEDNTP
ncbi:MAG: YesL family protein [Oscillospiraceae bacterium]|nr:YesL family protein [Oscillospiraceae bacterium]